MSLQVIGTLAEKGDFNALMAYTGQTGQKVDYMHLLQTQMMNNGPGAVALAKMLIKQSPPPVEVNVVTDLFLQRNMVREATGERVCAGQRQQHVLLPLACHSIDPAEIFKFAFALFLLSSRSLLNAIYLAPLLPLPCSLPGEHAYVTLALNT